MKLFDGFALSVNMLTVVPFFKVHEYFKGINGYSAMFYPLVGFFLGLFLWGVHSLLAPFLPPMHLGVILFALWVLLTGALHLDGLSDTIDGLFVSKEKALEVMKDSHVGGMGMIFTFVFLALKLSSVVAFEEYALLPVILMFSRTNATLAIYFYPYISSGIGALLKEELSSKLLLIALGVCTLVSLFFGTLWLGLLSLGVLGVLGRFFTKRLGGLNGDIYGLIIEVSELMMLNAIIVVYS